MRRIALLLCCSSILLTLVACAEQAAPSENLDYAKRIPGLDSNEEARRYRSGSLIAAVALAEANGMLVQALEAGGRGLFAVRDVFLEVGTFAGSGELRLPRDPIWIAHATAIANEANRILQLDAVRKEVEKALQPSSTGQADAKALAKATDAALREYPVAFNGDVWRAYVWFNYVYGLQGWLPDQTLARGEGLAEVFTVNDQLVPPGFLPSSTTLIERQTQAEYFHNPTNDPSKCIGVTMEVQVGRADSHWRRPSELAKASCGASTLVAYSASVARDAMDQDELRELMKKVCKKEQAELFRTLPSGYFSAGHYLMDANACDKATFVVSYQNSGPCDEEAVVVRQGKLQR